MSGPFAHPVKLDQIGEGLRVDISASDAEREDIARRLGLLSLDRLEAHAILSREGERVHVEGRVQALLGQSCVVTGEPVPAHVDEPFAVDVLPEPTPGQPEPEIELRPEDCDIMFHDGASVHLGAAVVDSLALALDPYPRSASADAALKEAGVISEEEAGPFAALAALRDKLGKQP
jgi:uncharacterized metal-binding protein YceD (DUF177 family)